MPLYLKSLALANFVTNSSQTKFEQYKNLPQAIESQWINFYQRGYIELEDVINVQKWLQVLCDIGYIFPSLKGNQSSKNNLENDLTMSDDNLFVDYR